MKRQRYPKNFKEQLVKEAQEIGNALSVARRHGVGPKTLYRWIQDSKHKAWEGTDANARKVMVYVPSPQEFRQIEKENNTLKKLLGEKDLEISILRDMVKKTRPGYPTE